MESIYTNNDLDLGFKALSQRKANFVANPIMDAKKKDLVLAKKIQQKCYKNFVREKAD